MGSIKSVYNVLFPSSPPCAPILDLPLTNSQMQPLLSSSHEEPLPGYPARHEFSKREVPACGEMGLHHSRPGTHRHCTGSAISWPGMHRKTDPPRTPAPVQHVLTHTLSGVPDETRTLTLISIAAVFQHHFNV